MAVSFDGTGTAYYTASSSWPSLQNNTAAETYGCWLRVDGYSSAHDSQVLGYDDTYSYKAHHWYITAAGAWRGYDRERKYGDEVIFDFGDHGADSVWRLCVHRADTTHIDTIYCEIGGAPVVAESRAYSGAEDYRTSGVIQIGRAYNTADQFIGAITDMWRVDRVLSDAEIADLAAGTPVDTVMAPINWWKLEDPADTTDYANDHADLIVTGTPGSTDGPAFGAGVSIVLGASQVSSIRKVTIARSGMSANVSVANTGATGQIVIAFGGVAAQPAAGGAQASIGQASASAGASAQALDGSVQTSPETAASSAGSSARLKACAASVQALQAAISAGQSVQVDAGNVSVHAKPVGVASGNSVSMSVVVNAGRVGVQSQPATASFGQRVEIDSTQINDAPQDVQAKAGATENLSASNVSVIGRMVYTRAGLRIETAIGHVSVTGRSASFIQGAEAGYFTAASITITPALDADIDIDPALTASLDIKPN